MIKRQEVAACWRKMVADFRRVPWFWVSGSRKQVHTFVGTRPGDLLGFPEQFGAVPAYPDDAVASLGRGR